MGPAGTAAPEALAAAAVCCKLETHSRCWQKVQQVAVCLVRGHDAEAAAALLFVLVAASSQAKVEYSSSPSWQIAGEHLQQVLSCNGMPDRGQQANTTLRW